MATYYEKNKDRLKEYNKKYYDKNKERIKKRTGIVAKRKYRENSHEINRNNNLKQLYNITLDDYNKMLNEQKSCCAICKKHTSQLKKILYVDHCHTKNEIRGLLCQNCNTLLGHAFDSILILESAIEYLKTNKN